MKSRASLNLESVITLFRVLFFGKTMRSKTIKENKPITKETNKLLDFPEDHARARKNLKPTYILAQHALSGLQNMAVNANGDKP